MLTRPSLKTIFRGLVCVSLVLLAFVLWLVKNPGFPRLYYGNTPKETAEILQNDVVWGFRAISTAVTYGDSVIPEIRTASQDFRLLNHRNSYCVAQVLGQIRTPLSERTARELYNRNPDEGDRDTLAFLCGARALALHGKLKSSGKLLQFIGDGIPIKSVFREMAIEAAGDTGDLTAVAPIKDVLIANGKSDYFLSELAYTALGKLADRTSVETLRTCMKDPEFRAPNSCFKALLAVRAPDAIPLAMARLKDATPNERDRLTTSLESVTGQKFGANQDAWLKWWKEKQANKP